jgi:hypothetical protein
MNGPKSSAPKFVIVSLSHEPAVRVEQGSMSRETFRTSFLEGYALRGERNRPGKDAVIDSALLATDGATVVTLPIWSWKVEDGSSRFLCQATDDGRAPAFTAFASSERELLDQILEMLRPAAED